MKTILDPCCGSRMFWFSKHDERTIYGDIRKESHTLCDGRTLNVSPDEIMDFTDLPFEDDRFNLVVFDPPHLAQIGERSWMFKKYGCLPRDWRSSLSAGFQECIRVLKPSGVLIFKWNESQVKLSEVLALAPIAPLFGNTSGRKAGTHWIVFMK